MSRAASPRIKKQQQTDVDPEAEAQLASTKNALFGDRKFEKKEAKRGEEKEEKKRDRALSSVTSEDEASIDRETASMSNFALGELDLTNEEWDLDDVDSDLEKFQQDAIVKEALSKGVDLRHYSRQIQSELRSAELLCVDDYMNESDNLAQLHGQIKTCDSILERMESMLTKFQGDLGAISSEIKHLQDKSHVMDIKVKNRKAAEGKLKKFIDGINITDELVTQLDEGDIDEKYASALKILDSRIKFLQQTENHDTRAAEDLAPIVHRLKLKAIARIREHLLTQFHALKKPKTNFQMKQQQKLLKIKYTYQFLLRYAGDSGDPSKDIAREVRVAYIETLSKIYLTKFKRYLTDMKKLQLETKVEKSDVIGADESKSHGFFGAKKTNDQLTRIFCLGQRDNVLSDAAADIISFTSASASGNKYTFERLFRSAQQLLMDTATSEYDFIVEFFGERMPRDADKAGVLEDEHRREQEKEREKERGHPSDTTSTDPTRPSTGSSTHRSTTSQHDDDQDLPYVRSDRDKNMFVHIFVKTISAFLENVESYLFHSWDALGLLLLIRIICQHNRTMQQKRVHCLDSFFDRMNGMLWKQFKQVLDENLKSLTQLKSIDRDKRIKGPHYVLIRYAELASGIHKLNKGYNDEILLTQLKRLRTEVDRLLTRTAALLPPKAQVIFLINNYNAIANILESRGAGDTDDCSFWKKLSQAQVALFIEQELGEPNRLGRMISFVKDTEFATSGVDEASYATKIDQAAMDAIVKHFAKYWKDLMEQMNTSVHKSFQDDASPADVETVLQQLFAQMVMYYMRFRKLVDRVPSLPMSIKKDLVPSQTILYEIKKYSNRE